MKPFVVQDDCQIPTLADIYNTYFHNVDEGFFIEVGAYDGRSWTNTGFLADIGWTGIYIEPVQYHMEMCKANHKNNALIFEQCAIGNKTEYKDIYVAGGLSTFDEQTKNAHDVMFNQGELQKERIFIQPLSAILEKYEIHKDFELLVVDTEGYEKEVFDSFDIKEYRPKMIIVELCDVHPSFNDFPEAQHNAKLVRQHIISNGYKEIYLDAINTIFWNTDE